MQICTTYSQIHICGVVYVYIVRWIVYVVLCTMHCMMYNVHPTLYTVHCKVCNIQCTAYNIRCTYNIRHTVKWCTFRHIVCTVHVIQFPYTVKHSLYDIQCTTYSIMYRTQCIGMFSLYTVHFIYRTHHIRCVTIF